MNRGDIEAKLRELGLSRRGAVYALNFVLDEVTEALKRGEPVEFPFGSLKKVRHPRGITVADPVPAISPHDAMAWLRLPFAALKK